MSLENLCECFFSLYEEAGHEVCRFGPIVTTYSGTRSPDFNLLFDLSHDPTSDNYKKNLQEALHHANTKECPFLFVQPPGITKNASEILKKFSFHSLGEVTSFSIQHENHTVHNTSSEYRCKQVTKRQEFSNWCEIVGEAFHTKFEDLQKVYSPILDSLLKEDTTYPLFLSYNEKNCPVSACQLYLPESPSREAGHYCWATKSAARRKGSMSFLVGEMVEFLKNRQVKSSCAQCYDTSLKVAEKAGFTAKGTLNIFTNAQG